MFRKKRKNSRSNAPAGKRKKVVTPIPPSIPYVKPKPTHTEVPSLISKCLEFLLLNRDHMHQLEPLPECHVQMLLKDLLFKRKSRPMRLFTLVGALFPMCTRLNLSGTCVDFRALYFCRGLVELNLSDTMILDEDLQEILRNNPELMHMDLSSCRWITQKAVQSICNHSKSIKSLLLNKCVQLSGKNLKQIVQNCTELTKIGISYWTNLYSMDLNNLVELKNLEYLDLSGNMHIHCMPSILPSLSSSPISSILLSNVPTLDDDILLSLFKHCNHITVLDLSYSGILSKHVLIAIPQTYPNMVKLSIAGQQAVDDFVVEDVVRYCGLLVELDVSYTGFVGNFFVKLGHPNLESLFVNGCMNVPGLEMVEMIKACCPKLRNLQVLNICPQTGDGGDQENIKIEVI